MEDDTCLDDDEVIDKASLGFIDSSSLDEEFDKVDFNEDDGQSTFEEDVSDCLEETVSDEPESMSLEIDVFNEDGFGEHFAEQLAKAVDGI